MSYPLRKKTPEELGQSIMHLAAHVVVLKSRLREAEEERDRLRKQLDDEIWGSGWDRCDKCATNYESRLAERNESWKQIADDNLKLNAENITLKRQIREGVEKLFAVGINE